MIKNIKKHTASLLAAVLIPLLIVSGLLGPLSNMISDLLYQRPSATDGEIIVIAMDQPSLEALGPLPWPRDYMAKVIRQLNADPDTAPAVIGLDVVYAGPSDPAADEALTLAAGEGQNVAVASAAQFGSQLIIQGEDFYLDSMAVVAWDGPYEALAPVTKTGHINAMADEDGYLRHALHRVRNLQGEPVPSLAWVIYESYAYFHGLELTPQPQTDSRGFFYLPYTTGPRSYDSGLSFVDVMNGEIDPQIFSGKMVLIGPYAAGLQDEYHTAISHGVPMYGVEVLANQIEAYRTGFYLRESSNGLSLALLSLWSFLLSWSLRNRSVKASIGIWLGTSLGWIGVCLGAYRLGAILPVLPFPLASAILFMVSLCRNYLHSTRERKRITDTFRRYVDPVVLKELLVQGGAAEQLGGDLREIAVLFVDIRGFTAMSEALEPPTVVDILNRYLTLTTNCIMSHQGTLDKFVGDCTMAFWNAPVHQEDPVYLACRAAADMIAQAAALEAELMKTYGRTIRFGIGIHVGPAVVGNIGAPQRMDYTAIGDTVNTAARLEANAPEGKILISRAVADALGSRAQVTSLGSSVKLKGKSEDFEVLTLDKLL